MWHNHNIYFARWLHSAVWHVALESWQWIHQVAAPCNVAGGSGMTCHWIRPNVWHIGILHLVSISTISSQSTCHSAPICKIVSKSDHPRQKNDVMSIFKMADPIIGSMKSPCKTSYGSSIDTIALNCLVFLRKSRFFVFWRQTDRQTNRWTASIH